MYIPYLKTPLTSAQKAKNMGEAHWINSSTPRHCYSVNILPCVCMLLLFLVLQIHRKWKPELVADAVVVTSCSGLRFEQLRYVLFMIFAILQCNLAQDFIN